MKKEARKVRPELRGVELSMAGLDALSRVLNIKNPEAERVGSRVRERAKLLRSAIEQIDPRTEADIPCHE